MSDTPPELHEIYGCSVRYYKPYKFNGMASCRSEEATSIEVEVYRYGPTFKYRWPEDKYALENLYRLIEKMHERGQEHKQAEIKDTFKLLLGI